MVSLPDLDVLYDLPRLLAPSGPAYHVVRDALPWAFESPPFAATPVDPGSAPVHDFAKSLVDSRAYYRQERTPAQAQQPAVSRAQTRPPERLDEYAHQGWPAPPPTTAPQYGAQYYPEAGPSHHGYPADPRYMQPAAHADEGEYEIIETRDPQTGATVHFRRRIQHERYQHYEDGLAQTYPTGEEYRRAGTVAPPARNEAEDYDPRYPAGSGPGRY